MRTLSKEPDTSDGMKVLLSTEGVKKSLLRWGGGEERSVF